MRLPKQRKQRKPQNSNKLHIKTLHTKPNLPFLLAIPEIIWFDPAVISMCSL